MKKLNSYHKSTASEKVVSIISIMALITLVSGFRLGIYIQYIFEDTFKILTHLSLPIEQYGKLIPLHLICINLYALKCYIKRFAVFNRKIQKMSLVAICVGLVPV